MDALDPIERPETLTSLAYGRIKSLLIDGKLEPKRVYPASQFADILGVSRTPVREALLQLTSEGYLDSFQGRGFSVREFSRKEIEDFFEVRKLIETYVIHQLIEVASKIGLEQLEANLDCMERKEREGDWSGFLEADRDFHMAVLLMYGNTFLCSVMDNIRTLLSVLGLRALGVLDERMGQVVSEHRRIVDSVRRGDAAGTVQAIADHLDSTKQHVFQSYRFS